MELSRNDPCQCGSGLKYKHCCLKMHQERKRWEGLENNLRESITEYWQKFHENDLYDAFNIYGKIIDKNAGVTERRLFFDWFIHDFVIHNNSNTIIKLFLKEYEKEESNDTAIERDTLREWSDSFFRLVEVLEIKVGTGYKISDIFTKEEFFLHDVRSSTTIEKYDILYVRLYRVGGSIIRASGGLILLPHRYLNNIRKYVINNMRKKYHETNFTDPIIFNLNLEKYLKNESLSLIQYLDLLSNQTTAETVTTFQGDIAVLSESNFIITNRRRIISILNSSDLFAYVGDYEEGYNDYDDIIRYDWIEKIDVTSNETNYLIGNVIEKQEGEDTIDDNELEEAAIVQLNTILWLPNSSSLSSKNKKKYSRKNYNNEEFVPYRVLGNLSIKGKTMTISCMSDKLLKKCNDIINNIAGKYLVYLGDKYTELQYDIKENELDVNLKKNSKDNANIGINIAEDDLCKYSTEEDEEIPPAITKQIDGFFEEYHENWINMKIPYLNNKAPLEIIKTKEGKEKIENMLRDIENEYARSAEGDLPFFPVEKIRKRLGLD